MIWSTPFLNTRKLGVSRIDINVADQIPFIKASKDILGDDGCYFMVAYKPLQASSAFRLWCKANNYNFDEYNEIAKELDKYRDDKKWGSVIKDSEVFVGVIESVAPSPCSFLMLDKPISEEIGLLRVGNEKGTPVMCCNLDGYNCDVYKHLKNDILQVTVWDIINKVYKRVGRPIDTIPQLLKLISEDNLTWEMYSKGLTATLNQADSDYATPLVMKYSPKNWAELSAFVASIRPGFSSLMHNFIERKPYSNGVEELDNLLSGSFHYMMYQENVMQYLIWLGIEEKVTYDIVKKIAKKKFKEEELVELKSTLLEGWIYKTGKEDGFAETWEVVERNAFYSFNSSHSASVAMDSMYGAYLKSHYPLEYYETILNTYQDDQEKTTKITNELPYFNITINPIKFGKSSSSYTMDKATNSIYKGISSIKYCNSSMAEELLALSKEKEYNKDAEGFMELINDIQNKKICNLKQLTILIILDFFSEFGKNQYLLNILDIFIEFSSIKIINKKKIEVYANRYGLTERMIVENSGKETASQFRELDNKGLINIMVSKLKNISMPVVNQIQAEKEYLGYITYVNPDMQYDKYIVSEFTTYKNKNTPYLVLRSLKTGEEIKTKISSSKIFVDNPFDLYSVLDCLNFTAQNKNVKRGGEWVKSDEKEFVLTEYEVIKM